MKNVLAVPQALTTYSPSLFGDGTKNNGKRLDVQVESLAQRLVPDVGLAEG
jgi:hypothetical protein